MKNTVEKIYDAAARNKLTVTASKVSIRFKIGLPDEERQRVECFLERVGRILQEDPSFAERQETVRGNLALHEPSDTLYIVMRNVEKTFSRRFFENEDENKRQVHDGDKVQGGVEVRTTPGDEGTGQGNRATHSARAAAVF